MRFVTAREMQEIDRKAIEVFGIPSLILMENAGIACASETMRLLKFNRGKIAVLAGKGNNGGDGFVAARHLANKGFDVSVFFFQNPAEMKPDPLTNFRILKKMSVGNRHACSLRMIDCSDQVDFDKIKTALKNANVVVDALFGTGLSKPVEDPFKAAIELVNASKVPVVAVDIPSGLNGDTGEVMGVCMNAKITVSLALPKKAFLMPAARNWTGKVIVADISIPRELLSS